MANRQRGISTVAMIVALVVGAVLLAGSIRASLESANNRAGTAAGQALFQINKALGAYVTDSTRAELLRTGGAIPGVANTMAPTVAELQALGLLSGNMSTTPANGGSYRTSVLLLPAGCSGHACNIGSRLWLSEPVIDAQNNGLDIKRLGAIMAILEGNGGFSDAQSPATIRGTGGWTLANPDPAARPGIVLAINGFGAMIDPNYVRMRDTRDPDLQGKLTVTGNVVSKGYLGLGGAPVTLGAACTAASSGYLGKTSAGIVLICNGTTWQNVSGIDQVVTAGAACTAGEVGRNDRGVLLSCRNGVFDNAAGFAGDVIAGAACTSSGLFGIDDDGRSYLCRGGRWVAQTNLSPSAVEMGRYVVRDSSVYVPKPTCAAGGTQTYDMTPISVSLDLTVAPPYSALEYAATDYGWAWLPRITLIAPDGDTQSANLLNVSALMRVYCTYPA